MNVFVFDVDDTIIIHTKEGNDYYNSNKNTVLRDLLFNLNNSVFTFIQMEHLVMVKQLKRS